MAKLFSSHNASMEASKLNSKTSQPQDQTTPILDPAQAPFYNSATTSKDMSHPITEGIRFTNVYNGLMVTSRSVIIHGWADPGKSGEIGSQYKDNTFPSQRCPMVNGHFTAVVFLEPGQNTILFEVIGQPSIRSEIVLIYTPLDANPPIHYVLLLGSDSKGTVDAPPYKLASEGNSLELSIKKMRLAAYLQAAFTQEQHARNLFGFRTFRPYEEVEKCTVSNRDDKPSRRTVHVHVVRCKETVADIRDANRAQQNPNATEAGSLFGIAANALVAYGAPFSNSSFTQAACIFIDTHWDPKAQLVCGHAALGGSINQLRLAIFGSHAMHTWPSCIEDMVTAFSDATVNDLRYVANDADKGGCAWEALNVSLGAFMHEIGHCLGSPHEPSGVMLRGYLEFNRSFVVRDGYSPRLGKVPCPLVQRNDENYWHRLDILRYRFHRSFALPSDSPITGAGAPIFFPTEDGVDIQSESEGIFLVDCQINEMSRTFFEYLHLPTAVQISMKDVLSRLSVEDRKKTIRIEAHCPGMKNASLDDVKAFMQARGPGNTFQSSIMGCQVGEQLTAMLPRDFRLASVVVHSGSFFDGFTFVATDGRRVSLGYGGGSPHEVKLANGDELQGINIRSGAWCDAGGIITRGGSSPLFGGTGGGLTVCRVPAGYRIAGITGWFSQFCRGIAMLYEKA